MKPVIVVGTGYMAQEYIRCFAHLGVPVTVLGRSESHRSRFEAEGSRYLCGTVQSNSHEFAVAQIVVICCSIESNLEVLMGLNQVTSARIYLEKPGFLSSETWKSAEVPLQHSQMWVVFNRRFFNVVQRFREGIASNPGGMLSVDISDDIHSIESSTKGSAVQQNWVVANSIHVLDLARWLTGGFDLLSSRAEGGISCHLAGHVFSGEGRASNGVFFKLVGEFCEGGRWKIAYETDHVSYVLKPLEKLEIRDLVTKQSQVFLESETSGLKPGLLAACKSMLSAPKDERFCAFRDLGAILSMCEIVGGYEKKRSSEKV